MTSDEKRPLVDYSQDLKYYEQISTPLDGNLIEVKRPASTPFAKFDSTLRNALNEKKPGTFTFGYKKSGEASSGDGQDLGEAARRDSGIRKPKVGGELKPNDNAVQEVARQKDVASIADELGLKLKRRDDGSIIFEFPENLERHFKIKTRLETIKEQAETLKTSGKLSKAQIQTLDERVSVIELLINDVEDTTTTNEDEAPALLKIAEGTLTKMEEDLVSGVFFVEPRKTESDEELELRTLNKGFPTVIVGFIHLQRRARGALKVLQNDPSQKNLIETFEEKDKDFLNFIDELREKKELVKKDFENLRDLLIAYDEVVKNIFQEERKILEFPKADQEPIASPVLEPANEPSQVAEPTKQEEISSPQDIEKLFSLFEQKKEEVAPSIKLAEKNPLPVFDTLIELYRKDTAELESLKEKISKNKDKELIEEFNKKISLYETLVAHIIKEIYVEKRGRSPRDINIKSLRFDPNTKKTKIKKGGVFVEMTPEEEEAYRPIETVLQKYRDFNNDNYRGFVKGEKDYNHSDYNWLTGPKDELMDALMEEPPNFLLAQEKAKEIEAAIEYTIEIRDKIRNYNLNLLKSGYTLNDDSIDFAYIKDHTKGLRTINKKTGDWVFLNNEDENAVKRARGALAMFKNRLSTPRGSIDEKNKIIALVNDYKFKEAGEAAEAFIAHYEKLLKEKLPDEAVESPFSLDVYSGWPEDIKVTTIKGDPSKKIKTATVWTYLDKHGVEQPLKNTEIWGSLKTNFDIVFNAYKAFLDSGDSERKIQLNGTLIRTKNDIIEELRSRNTVRAHRYINDFRTRLAEATSSWEKRVKEENAEKERQMREAAAEEKAKNERLEVKKATLRLFETANTELQKVYTLRDGFFNEIKSPLEKESIIKQSKQLDALRAAIQKDIHDDVDVDRNIITSYRSNIETLRGYLTVIDARITKLNTVKVARGKEVLVRSSTNLTKDSRVLRKGGLPGEEKPSIAYEDWEEQQKRKPSAQPINNVEELQESLENGEIYRFHKSLFEKNKDEYLRDYLEKEWPSGDYNKIAVDKVIEEYIESLRRKAEALSAEERTLRKELEETKDEDRKNIVLLAMEELMKEIEAFNKEIQDLRKARGAVRQQKVDSALTRVERKTLSRETYAPVTVNKQVVDQISGTNLKEEEGLTAEDIQARRTKESLLSDRLSPNHYAGMVRQENGAEQPPSPPSPEAVEKRKIQVGKLQATIIKNRSRFGGSAWKALGLAVLVGGLAGGTWELVDSIEKKKVPDIRAELAKDAAKTLHWRSYINEKDRPLFERFIGENSLSFIDWVKKNAPAVTIDNNNASTLEAVSSLNCRKLLTGELEAGESVESRKQLCRIVLFLQDVIQKAPLEGKVLPDTAQQPDLLSYVNENVTLRDLFDRARALAGVADTNHAQRLANASMKKS